MSHSGLKDEESDVASSFKPECMIMRCTFGESNICGLAVDQHMISYAGGIVRRHLNNKEDNAKHC